jgi:hypothetical protein
MRSSEPRRWRLPAAVAMTVAMLASAPAARAQSEGGLYIAGAGFSFEVAAERGLRQNPGGRRFFVLALPAEAAALAASAGGPAAALRERVLAANGVLLVCRRDVASGRIDGAALAPGVAVVRGWPAPGSNELPKGERYFPDEDRSRLPAANEALRQLRSTCA